MDINNVNQACQWLLQYLQRRNLTELPEGFDKKKEHLELSVQDWQWLQTELGKFIAKRIER